MSSGKRKMILRPRRSGRTSTVAKNAANGANLGKHVLVIARSSVEIDIIFQKIKGRVIYGMVRRDITKPFYELALHNGGRVRGIAIGRNGSCAMCGQQADLILVDNFDLIDRHFFDSVLFPVLQSDLETDVELYGVSKEFVVDSDEKLFDSKMRWPRSLFHSPQVELIRDILKNELWETDILPKVEGKPELGKCGWSGCRGVTKQVNQRYCKKCQGIIDRACAQKEKKDV